MEHIGFVGRQDPSTNEPINVGMTSGDIFDNEANVIVQGNR
jgi:hypothetical protein